MEVRKKEGLHFVFSLTDANANGRPNLILLCPDTIEDNASELDS